MVPQHGPFSLHTMLEGPWLHKTAFPTPMARPSDESQGSSPLQGRGSWLMCEVALRPKLLYVSECWISVCGFIRTFSLSLSLYSILFYFYYFLIEFKIPFVLYEGMSHLPRCSQAPFSGRVVGFFLVRFGADYISLFPTFVAHLQGL